MKNLKKLVIALALGVVLTAGSAMAVVSQADQRAVIDACKASVTAVPAGLSYKNNTAMRDALVSYLNQEKTDGHQVGSKPVTDDMVRAVWIAANKADLHDAANISAAIDKISAVAADYNAPADTPATKGDVFTAYSGLTNEKDVRAFKGYIYPLNKDKIAIDSNNDPSGYTKAELDSLIAGARLPYTVVDGTTYAGIGAAKSYMNFLEDTIKRSLQASNISIGAPVRTDVDGAIDAVWGTDLEAMFPSAADSNMKKAITALDGKQFKSVSHAASNFNTVLDAIKDDIVPSSFVSTAYNKIEDSAKKRIIAALKKAGIEDSTTQDNFWIEFNKIFVDLSDAVGQNLTVKSKVNKVHENVTLIENFAKEAIVFLKKINTKALLKNYLTNLINIIPTHTSSVDLTEAETLISNIPTYINTAYTNAVDGRLLGTVNKLSGGIGDAVCIEIQ